MKNNKLGVVTYMANRYGTGYCSECKKEFWFMVGELIPNKDKNKLTLKCAVCGFNGNMTFDSVKENIKKDGYNIESLSEFEKIQEQARLYNEQIKNRRKAKP